MVARLRPQLCILLGSCHPSGKLLHPLGLPDGRSVASWRRRCRALAGPRSAAAARLAGQVGGRTRFAGVARSAAGMLSDAAGSGWAAQ